MLERELHSSILPIEKQPYEDDDDDSSKQLLSFYDLSDTILSIWTRTIH